MLKNSTYSLKTLNSRVYSNLDQLHRYNSKKIDYSNKVHVLVKIINTPCEIL